MEVTITRDDLAYARDEGTVIVMTGTGPDGEQVTFGGDRRAVEALAEGVYAEGEATAVVEPHQVLNTVPQRIASVARHHSGRPSPEEVSAYLPGNYRVLWSDDERVMIAGNDNAGWTLNDYVIPRLASGLIHAREVTAVQWPCGCLKNEAGAHRAGCPDHPEV